MKTSYNKKKKRYSIKDFFPLFFFIATMFISIGFAKIGSIDLNIGGTITASMPKIVMITNVTYNAEESKSVDTSLNSYVETETMLYSNVVLDEIDNTSKITYDIEIFNNNGYYVYFSEIFCEPNNPEGANNNDNIVFEISRKNENNEYVSLNQNDILAPNEKMYVRLTFHYNSTIDKSITDFNKLSSYITFKFIYNAVYTYVGSEQFYKAPITGTYKIELWGAQGGGGPRGTNGPFYEGGKGGYVSGNIELTENDIIYIYVGGKGEDYKSSSKYRYGGYNGGGDGYNYAYAGGGATDIRLVSGAWDDFESLKSRIMVAGGGGGSSTDYLTSNGAWCKGGSGGGLSGLDAVTLSSKYIAGFGASQTEGFAFGKGYSVLTKNSYPGGGSGYYGSKSATETANGTASWYLATGGGSSFVSGHNGCDAIEKNSTSDNIVHTGQSIHYSGLYFTDTVVIDGSGYNWTTEQGTEIVGMPTYDGNSTMTGNEGNGYVKISLVSVSNNNE